MPLQGTGRFLVASLIRTHIRTGCLGSEIEQQSRFSPPWHELNSLQVVFHFLIYADANMFCVALPGDCLMVSLLHWNVV